MDDAPQQTTARRTLTTRRTSSPLSHQNSPSQASQLAETQSQSAQLSTSTTPQPDSASEADNTYTDDDSTVESPLTANIKRLTRKRAASIDVGKANGTRIERLTLGSPAIGEGGADLICICPTPPKVPRPRNAFILYRQHHQARCVADHPGCSNPEVSKILGDQWKHEPGDVKSYWQLLAEEEKLRHQQQYPDYRYQPRRGGKAGGGLGGGRTGSVAAGDSGRCAKCGKRFIATPRTPAAPYSLASTPTTGSTLQATERAGQMSAVAAVRAAPYAVQSPRSAAEGRFPQTLASAAQPHNPGMAQRRQPSADMSLRRGSVQGSEYYEDGDPADVYSRYPTSYWEVHQREMGRRYADSDTTDTARSPHDVKRRRIIDYEHSSPRGGPPLGTLWSSRPSFEGDGRRMSTASHLQHAGPGGYAHAPPIGPRTSLSQSRESATLPDRRASVTGSQISTNTLPSASRLYPPSPLAAPPASSSALAPSNGAAGQQPGAAARGAVYDHSLTLAPLKIPNSPKPIPQAQTPTTALGRGAAFDARRASDQTGHSGAIAGMTALRASAALSAKDGRARRDLEFMMRSIPFMNKLGVLRKISTPIGLTAISTSEGDSALVRGGNPRGPVIAIEGPDAALCRHVGAVVEKAIRGSDEFDLRIWKSEIPAEDRTGAISSTVPASTSAKESSPDTIDTNNQTPSLASYLAIVTEWHVRSQQIATHVSISPSLVPSSSTTIVPSSSTTIAPSSSTTIAPSSSTNIAPSFSTSNPFPGIDRRASLATIPGTQDTPITDASHASLVPISRTPHTNKTKSSMPVALITPAFSLSLADYFAAHLAITEPYSPVDHWQWMAALWRGIVGADLVVYVRPPWGMMPGGGRVTATPACLSSGDVGGSSTLPLPATPGGGGDTGARVEMRSAGVMEIRCGGGSGSGTNHGGMGEGQHGGLDEKTERRLAFEVLEWIRAGELRSE